MHKTKKFMTERQAWKKIYAQIERDWRTDGQMAWSGLCLYIEEEEVVISAATASKMKARLLTKRYTEDKLCLGHRWEERQPAPRLRFIRQLLKTRLR